MNAVRLLAASMASLPIVGLMACSTDTTKPLKQIAGGSSDFKEDDASTWITDQPNEIKSWMGHTPDLTLFVPRKELAENKSLHSGLYIRTQAIGKYHKCVVLTYEMVRDDWINPVDPTYGYKPGTYKVYVMAPIPETARNKDFTEKYGPLEDTSIQGGGDTVNEFLETPKIQSKCA